MPAYALAFLRANLATYDKPGAVMLNPRANDLWRRYLEEDEHGDPAAAEILRQQYLQALETVDDDKGESSDDDSELDETFARAG